MNTLEHENTLLNAEERMALQEIAGLETLHGQRAQALLALDKGGTQSQAAAGSGLSPGQVKYCLARFRRDGMNMFHEASVPDTESETPSKEDAPVKEREEVPPNKGKMKKSELKAKKTKKEKKKSKKKSKKDGKKKEQISPKKPKSKKGKKQGKKGKKNK